MSILPLTGACVEAHAWEMTNNPLLRSAPHDNQSWDGVLARVRAPFLDRQLAAGCLQDPAGPGHPLTDGTGPLHSRRPPPDLGAEVREATRQMTPFAGASSDGADWDSEGCYR